MTDVPDPTMSRAARAGGCPLCGSPGHVPFREVDGYRFRRCDDCGFVFLSPMPSGPVLESMYNQDQVISPDFYPKAGSRYRRALIMALRLLPYARGREVLDLGCGGGFQVGAFRRLGARAAGLDISEPSITFARRRFPRCMFYCEDFASFRKRSLKFGLVYSSEVIEHVVDLNEYMELLRGITESRGHVYLTTPDIGSPGVPSEILDWDVFSPPRHVQFFGQANLERLFATYGFTAARRFPDRKTGLRMLFRRR